MTGLLHALRTRRRRREGDPRPHTEKEPAVIAKLDRRIAAGRHDLAPLRDQLAERIGGGR